MTAPEFYPPTKAILESRPDLFVKVEAHVASDPESSDLLWLEYTPEDPLSEGEVICISPLGDSWYVSRDSAFKYGGWTTDWDATGTADDVFLACSDIQKKGTRKEMDELLDAFETKNRRLTDDLEAMDLDSKSLWDEVNALKAENEKLRKDAERFEYLMDCIKGIRPDDGARGSGVYTWLLQIREPINVPTEGELMHSEIRAAIDAAMTAPDTKGE